MLSKQSVLGIVIMVCGGVLLFALSRQPEPTQSQATKAAPTVDASVARPVVQPLTADIETEARILEEKKKQREAQVKAREQETNALLESQEQARQAASEKAQAESEAYNARTLTVQTRPESAQLAKEQAEAEARAELEAKARKAEQAVTDKSKAEQEKAQKAKEQKAQADKAKEEKLKADKAKADKEAEQKATQTSHDGKHTVQTGDTLIRLSRQYGVPVSILAKANNMGRHDSLPKGKTIKIPTASEVKKIEAEIQKAAKEEAEQKAAIAKKEQANQRLADARRDAKSQGVNDNYGVQVALAADKARAEALVAKLKAAGYKVSTSQTSKGIRVMVGPERSKEAALALRDKVNNDSAVGTKGAWVLQIPESGE